MKFGLGMLALGIGNQTQSVRSCLKYPLPCFCTVAVKEYIGHCVDDGLSPGIIIGGIRAESTFSFIDGVTHKNSIHPRGSYEHIRYHDHSR